MELSDVDTLTDGSLDCHTCSKLLDIGCILDVDYSVAVCVSTNLSITLESALDACNYLLNLGCILNVNLAVHIGVTKEEPEGTGRLRRLCGL